jgi:hypothetical protein
MKQDLLAPDVGSTLLDAPGARSSRNAGGGPCFARSVWATISVVPRDGVRRSSTSSCREETARTSSLELRSTGSGGAADASQHPCRTRSPRHRRPSLRRLHRYIRFDYHDDRRSRSELSPKSRLRAGLDSRTQSSDNCGKRCCCVTARLRRPRTRLDIHLAMRRSCRNLPQPTVGKLAPDAPAKDEIGASRLCPAARRLRTNERQRYGSRGSLPRKDRGRWGAISPPARRTVGAPVRGHGTSHGGQGGLFPEAANIRLGNNLGNNLSETERYPATRSPMNPGFCN